jgi:hypothetical protein
MTNQRANLVLAPRAGFEPATNRLTAARHRATQRFLSHPNSLPLQRKGAIRNLLGHLSNPPIQVPQRCPEWKSAFSLSPSSAR